MNLLRLLLLRPAVVRHHQQPVPVGLIHGQRPLRGAHVTLVAENIRRVRERDAGDIVGVGGGIIPDADVEALRALGVDKVFTPGTSLDEAVAYGKQRFGKVAA